MITVIMVVDPMMILIVMAAVEGEDVAVVENVAEAGVEVVEEGTIIAKDLILMDLVVTMTPLMLPVPQLVATIYRKIRVCMGAG